MNTQPREYRFEVKVPVPLNRLQEVQIWLQAHNMLFRQHYEPRDINSLYLDTPFLARYEENLSGISTRKKSAHSLVWQFKQCRKSKIGI